MISPYSNIPQQISRLGELAYNLWWVWNDSAQELYRELDPELWDASAHNPILLLKYIENSKLIAASNSENFLERYRVAIQKFDTYMSSEATWCKQNLPDLSKGCIAYFSAEFGLHECLPIYSGGLGILAGDHCKEASDLGLPLVGVGFLYPQGYFKQRINREGVQEAIYEKLDFSNVPAVEATDLNGKPVIIHVDLPGRQVFAKVWKIQIGRVVLYLMDTDIEPNAPFDRDLSARLYGGDHEMRIAQEIVLGIGGVRALRALGINPTVWHMNEGHPAFLALERSRELAGDQGLSFAQARERIAADTLFTTHTPVPAGNDAFSYELVDRYLSGIWDQIGMSRDDFFSFACQEQPWGPTYSMTVLALRFSDLHNGVSKLHGDVSRHLWQFIWPEKSIDEVPVGYITNGVHVDTWLASSLKILYQQHIGPAFQEQHDNPRIFTGIDEILDKEIWDRHSALKVKLQNYLNNKTAGGPEKNYESENLTHALTIGFARRFATYKRATLLFQDIERLKRLLSIENRPVRIIFAGKAHPADEPGKDLIKQIYHLAHSDEFFGKVLLLEDYDINMARHLVQGVDLWLNNPIRPHEASGTSGQKAAINGVLNCSVLDGWWDEGYNGENGWAIYENDGLPAEQRDAETASAIYGLLENEIIPLFFARGDQGVPTDWVIRMKSSIRSNLPHFSARRMVKEYAEKFYSTANNRSTVFLAGMDRR